MIKLGFIGNLEMFNLFVESNKENNNFTLNFINIKEDYNKILDLDYVIIRSTVSREDLVKQFVINNPNINFLDNLERFTNIRHKYETSIERYNLGIGANTFKDIDIFTTFPIIAKPIKGKKCIGIKYLNNYQDYLNWKDSINLNEYFFQSKLNLKEEFRVLTLHLNKEYEFFIIRKTTICGLENNQKGIIPKRSLCKFIIEKRSEKIGIIGYDIGQLEDNSFIIIEENRAPMFDKVEHTLKISIPKEILDFIYKIHINK